MKKWIGIAVVLAILSVGIVCLINVNRKSNQSEIADKQKKSDIHYQEAETSQEKALQKAVRQVMPQKVVEVTDHGVWSRIMEGKNQTSYLLSNAQDHDDVTLRLDFAYQGEKLVSYVSKEYGFVDEMPEEHIHEKQAVVLVQKFAEAFLDKKLETGDIKEIEIPARYEGGAYANFQDREGNQYLVQLNHNMVVRFEGKKM